MKEYTYNVMVIVDGYSEIHTADLSEDEAEKLSDKLKELFPDYNYYVDLVEDAGKVEMMERLYNNNAVDGWEDIYPDRDY